MDFLKYPVGTYSKPQNITKANREDWIESIRTLPSRLRTLLKGWDDTQLNTEYRPGAWTVRQLIHHIADSHMNSLIRFKWGLTENNPTIKVYNQDAWIGLADVKNMSADVSLQLLDALHQRFVSLLEGMNDSDFKRTIYHPEMQTSFSLEELLALYGWHSEHHYSQILQLKNYMKW